MIITESNVSMSSNRQYTASGIKGAGISGARSTAATVSSISSSVMDSYENYGEDFLGTYERLLGNPISTRNVSNIGSNDDSVTKKQAVRNEILRSLMDKFMQGGAFGNNFGGLTKSAAGGMVGRIQTYYEEESTGFSAKGMAKTADGRTIDFDIDIFMSRSYMEYTDIQINPLNNILMDPLTINVGNDVTKISDQKFMFDLNYDGKEEEISSLAKGSGFLALDLNEDGIINDGRELFGAKTGDGFGELREYDKDGNGWIDEADEVFSRLKVWCKDEDGKDVLMDLKEAGVGAIYLGEQQTDFSMYGLNGLNGVVRSTGFFLKESGEAGTVQHVDLAVNTGSSTGMATESNSSSIQIPGMSAKSGSEFGVLEGQLLTVEMPDRNKETKDSEDDAAIARVDNTAKNSASKNAQIRKEAQERRNRRLADKKYENDKRQKEILEKRQKMDELEEKIAEKSKERTERFEELSENDQKDAIIKQAS